MIITVPRKNTINTIKATPSSLFHIAKRVIISTLLFLYTSPSLYLSSLSGSNSAKVE